MPRGAGSAGSVKPRSRARLHPLVVFKPEAFALLVRLEAAHLVPILGTLLLAHELAAVDLVGLARRRAGLVLRAVLRHRGKRGCRQQAGRRQWEEIHGMHAELRRD